MVKLFDTTLGKVIKTALWAGLSAVVAFVIKEVATLNWGQYALLAPVVNTVLVGIKNAIDNKVPNLPSK